MTNKIMFYISLFNEKSEGKKGLRIRTNLNKDPLTHIIFSKGSRSLLELSGAALESFKENLVASIRSTVLFDFKNAKSRQKLFKIVFEEESAVEGTMHGDNFQTKVTDVWSLEPEEQKMIRGILFEKM